MHQTDFFLWGAQPEKGSVGDSCLGVTVRVRLTIIPPKPAEIQAENRWHTQRAQSGSFEKCLIKGLFTKMPAKCRENWEWQYHTRVGDQGRSERVSWPLGPKDEEREQLLCSSLRQRKLMRWCLTWAVSFLEKHSQPDMTWQWGALVNKCPNYSPLRSC